MLENTWQTDADDDVARGDSTRMLGAAPCHRLLLPHGALWIEIPDQPARLASACTAQVLPPDVPVRTELIDPSCEGIDLIALPDELWACVRQALHSALPAHAAEPWRWSGLRVDAADYLTLRLLRRAQPADAAPTATWTCAQLRRALGDWRRAASRTLRSARAQPSVQQHAMQQVARRMASRWREGTSLQRLAEQAGLSVFHLLRSFRSVHGVTPHQFLLQLRLRRALHLLGDGQQSGAALAERLGFCSHGHFCTAFRSAFGMTPSDYTAHPRGATTLFPSRAPRSLTHAPRSPSRVHRPAR